MFYKRKQQKPTQRAPPRGIPAACHIPCMHYLQCLGFPLLSLSLIAFVHICPIETHGLTSKLLSARIAIKFRFLTHFSNRVSSLCSFGHGLGACEPEDSLASCQPDARQDEEAEASVERQRSSESSSHGVVQDQLPRPLLPYAPVLCIPSCAEREWMSCTDLSAST